MKSVEKLNKKIKEILTAREKELTDSRNELTEAKVHLDDAEKEVIEKTKAGSKEEYINAKAEYDKAKAVVKMLEQRVSDIESRALISEDDYLSEVEKIKDECRKLVESDKGIVIPLLREIWDVYKREGKELDDANAVLRSLQHDIYRDEDCKNKNGDILRGKVQEYKDYEFVGAMRNCFIYDNVRELIGVDQEIKEIR